MHARMMSESSVSTCSSSIISSFSSLDKFLFSLGELICLKLRLNPRMVHDAWQKWGEGLGAKIKLTYFLEEEILPTIDGLLILAIDEADSLLGTNFYEDVFSLLRAWHNQRADFEGFWERLNLVLVISTEPYLLIKDINQSPFNVGARIELKRFHSRSGRSAKPSAWRTDS